MTELDDAVAAPLEAELGGKKVRLHPLALDDFGEWERWAKAAHLKAAAEAMDSLPATLRSQNMRDAHVASTRLYFGSPQAMGAMLSIPGRVRIVYLSLRRDLPDLTSDSLWGMLAPDGRPDFPVLDKLYCDIIRISGFGSAEGSGTANPQGAVMAILDMV